MKTFENALEANGINRPTGFFAQKAFDTQWQKAEECYKHLVACYYGRTREWRQISEELKIAWGYRVPSLVEVEGFVNSRFRTPAEAVRVCQQRLNGLNATDLSDYAKDIIDDFRSWWLAEIQLTAKAKDCTLVILRGASAKTPSLDEIRAFTTSITSGQEAVIKDKQNPIWVACSPENVKDYLKFFTRRETYVDFK